MDTEPRIVPLCDMLPEQQGDCFALLASKDRAKTRDGKPYYRVAFRDARRTVTAMIWSDSAPFADCEENWQVGQFYKLRCRYFENQYGSQVELDRIRPVNEADKADGFSPYSLCPATRFSVDEMYAEIIGIAQREIDDEPTQRLVLSILETYADDIRRSSAASRNHHAFAGGFLEHVLSVTRTAVYFADKYRDYYPDMQPPLSKSLVVAGAILHDIGKLRELKFQPQGSEYTAQGRLIGHILLGRDLLREAAAAIPELNPETLLRLEHIIVSHQNLPEWGSPIAPHTPEALLVYFADDVDAKFSMMAQALQTERQPDEEFSSRDNPLRRRVFRGLVEG
jgi:3'-5' exoribonuclease